MNFNKDTIIGIALGFLFTIIGFFIFGIAYSLYCDSTVGDYCSKFFSSNRVYAEFKPKILFVSVLFNLIPFQWATKKGKNNLATGVLITTLIFAIVIVYLYI